MNMLDQESPIASQLYKGETVMTTQSRRHNLSRLAIAGAFLLAGLAGTAQAATAGSPLADAGGPGGGSDAVAAGPSLVGSGPEREIVADSVAARSNGTLDETARSTDLIALSPESSSAIAVAPTEARFGQPF